MVIVITDEAMTESLQKSTVKTSAEIAGSYTEAQRAATAVRWVECCTDTTLEGVVALAVGELKCAYADNPKLEARDVMFIVWKHHSRFIDGSASKEIADAILGATFTADDVKAAAEKRKSGVYRDSDGYEDRDGDEPTDWWKR